MSLIEKAAKKLEELQNAGGRTPSNRSSPQSKVPLDRAGTRERPEPQLGPTPPTMIEASQAETSRTPGARRLVEPAAAIAINRVTIDLARLSTQGYVTPQFPQSRIADEFRAIKRPILKNIFGKLAQDAPNRNLVMVTSAMPGEGKSFVALNLAVSVAMEVDSRVLLIDADVVAPSIPRRLGIPSSAGLMDLLNGDAREFADVLLKTNVERLSLVLAGKRHSRAVELLASDAMSALLQEVSNRYADRLVIFDSPPLLATTESPVLATHMGQVIVVVEADRTTHRTVEQAFATVDSCPVVMSLLNKSAHSQVGSYYGYRDDTKL